MLHPLNIKHTSGSRGRRRLCFRGGLDRRCRALPSGNESQLPELARSGVEQASTAWKRWQDHKQHLRSEARLYIRTEAAKLLVQQPVELERMQEFTESLEVLKGALPALEIIPAIHHPEFKDLATQNPPEFLLRLLTLVSQHHHAHVPSADAMGEGRLHQLFIERSLSAISKADAFISNRVGLAAAGQSGTGGQDAKAVSAVIESSDVVSDDVLEELRHWIDYAEAAYNEMGGDEQQIERWLEARGYSLELASFGNKAHCPVFYVASNTDRQEVVVVVRGTMSLYDAVTDMIVTSDEWGAKDLTVHRGIGAAATLVHSRVKELVQEHAASGHSVVLVGHSLGAGVAALLAWLLRERDGLTDVRAIGYATPPCASRTLAEQTKDYVISCVMRDDAVPRITPRAMVALQEQALSLTWEELESCGESWGQLGKTLVEQAKKGLPGPTSSHDSDAEGNESEESVPVVQDLESPFESSDAEPPPAKPMHGAAVVSALAKAAGVGVATGENESSDSMDTTQTTNSTAPSDTDTESSGELTAVPEVATAGPRHVGPATIAAAAAAVDATAAAAVDATAAAATDATAAAADAAAAALDATTAAVDATTAAVDARAAADYEKMSTWSRAQIAQHKEYVDSASEQAAEFFKQLQINVGLPELTTDMYASAASSKNLAPQQQENPLKALVATLAEAGLVPGLSSTISQAREAVEEKIRESVTLQDDVEDKGVTQKSKAITAVAAEVGLFDERGSAALDSIASDADADVVVKKVMLMPVVPGTIVFLCPKIPPSGEESASPESDTADVTPSMNDLISIDSASIDAAMDLVDGVEEGGSVCSPEPDNVEIGGLVVDAQDAVLGVLRIHSGSVTDHFMKQYRLGLGAESYDMTRVEEDTDESE